MNRTATFLSLALAAGIWACGAPAEDPVPDRPGEPEAVQGQEAEEARQATEDIVVSDGTIRQIEVEGGCWVIDDAEGNRYELLELAQELRSDDLRVSAVLRPRPDMASICQVGQLVEVVSIEPNDE